MRVGQVRVRVGRRGVLTLHRLRVLHQDQCSVRVGRRKLLRLHYSSHNRNQQQKFKRRLMCHIMGGIILSAATSTSAQLNAQSSLSSTQATQPSTTTTSTTQPGQYHPASAYAYPQVPMSYAWQAFLLLEPRAVVKMAVLELMRTFNKSAN
ncbi:hypothetical protein M422DRAFT_39495 [Sphaerobolus stellatus SS14]|uniref:Unplaced genomic scaffold SPHSTscaffold_537, whole genome shotgun sequence n=1 Tax=Sphaerobolus stellatus (strain SS14) TaxID=990650 RepID=A0A0C9U3I5_SPHS4|nr:hypothetical protein M422DRAFT_39495 [Sphaerobolus stellatus SS14]